MKPERFDELRDGPYRARTKDVAELIEEIGRLRLSNAALVTAGEKMWAFFNDLANSNPGFMGKLVLQNYAQMNEAMILMPKALAAAKEARR